MTGFVSMRVGGDFREGHACGRDDGALVEVLLTIDYDDVQAVLNDPTRPAAIVGTVLAPELSPHRMTVTQGHFTLLDPDPSQPETWHMRYWMSLLAEDGKRYVFDGHKVIRKRGARHAWSDTTTLYTTIRELNGPGGTEIRRGTGILRLQASRPRQDAKHDERAGRAPTKATWSTGWPLALSSQASWRAYTAVRSTWPGPFPERPPRPRTRPTPSANRVTQTGSGGMTSREDGMPTRGPETMRSSA